MYIVQCTKRKLKECFISEENSSKHCSFNNVQKEEVYTRRKRIVYNVYFTMYKKKKSILEEKEQYTMYILQCTKRRSALYTRRKGTVYNVYFTMYKKKKCFILEEKEQYTMYILQCKIIRSA